MRFAPAAAILFLLAACAEPLPVDPPAGAPQPGDVIAGATGAGLEEREPDLCGLADYQSYIGLPGSTVAGLSFSRPFRVVEFGGIVTQEYDPSRVNFFLAPTGEITRIACG